MENLFGNIDGAISNTTLIADRCQVSIDFDKLYLPDYSVPDGYTLDKYLRELSYNSLAKRYPDRAKACTAQIKNPTPDDDFVINRMNHELEIISKMGYPGYFLIVWDFIKYAKEHSIPVGPGRGSAAGSLVAYALGITNLNPLSYGLLFERFLNQPAGE